MLHVKSFTFNAFSENSYIIYNDKGTAIIVDPGMYTNHEEEIFFNFIAEKKLNPIQIINTHCHLDHIYGVHAVKEKYGIPFGFHLLEQAVYAWAPQAGLKYGVPIKQLALCDFFINQKELIQLDEDFLEIRFAPGHSPGHICLYSKADNFVIAGDVIFQMSIGRTDLPGGDFDTLIQSIQTQIFTMPNETHIYSGHGPVTSVGFEKMNNPFLR